MSLDFVTLAGILRPHYFIEKGGVNAIVNELMLAPLFDEETTSQKYYADDTELSHVAQRSHNI